MSKIRERAKGLTPEEREHQMMSMAMDVAEQRIRNGTASNQLILHYVKLATQKEELEKEKLRKEIALLEAKKVATDSAARVEELYDNAIKAMITYGSSINHLGEDNA